MHVKALVEFLSGLEQNNNRPYFVAHKPAYDLLREEFEALVTDLIARVARFDPGLGAVEAKKAMFRIYRDTRFSKDKTPYKTHFSAALRARAKTGMEPGYYFHIDRHGVLLAGGGIYHPDPATLGRIRRHIARNPGALTRVLREPRFKKTFRGLSDEDALARPPKGFTADTPHLEAIKLKHYFALVEIDILKRPPKDLAGTIAAPLRDALPLLRWLRRAVAPVAP